MGEHIDTKHYGKKHKKTNEDRDSEAARQRRVTFKNYLREQEEELLEADLELDDDSTEE